MLAADQRLRQTDAFRRTVKSGRRAGGRALVLHLRLDETRPAGPPRAGFVVNKAVGGAVVRNRVKRRLRHLVRSHLTELPPSADLVVRALPTAASLSSAELGVELSRSLERVGADLRAARAASSTGSVTGAQA